MSTAVEQTLYLNVGGEDTLITLMAPDTDTPGTAVLIVPPFGWDAVTSHRPRRRWAEALVAAGHPTLRIDLPGTDDSAGGPRDLGRLDAWTQAVREAGAWLATHTASQRLAVLGIGLGGILAVRAAADAVWIDELVLWGTPWRGRSVVREMQAFAALQGDGSFWLPTAKPTAEELAVIAAEPPDYGMVVNGHLLSDPTVAELSAVDLTKLTWEPREDRRALLLGRDGRDPDARLSEALTSAGFAVSQSAADGYAEMLQEPRLARTPHATVGAVSAWLADGQALAPADPEVRAALTAMAQTVRSSDHLTMPGLRERPVSFSVGGRTLRGILCEPDVVKHGTIAVFLNSGAIRRIGPNRTWVEAARRWAQEGTASLRLDLPGIGDSDGEEDTYLVEAMMFSPELRNDTVGLLDALEQQGIASSFMLAGLCAGANWAFGAADVDPRVHALSLENPWALHWDAGLQTARDLKRARMLIARRENIEWALPYLRATLPKVLLTLPLMLIRKRRRTRRLRATLDRLQQRGVQVRIDLSVGEPLYDDLRRDGVLGNSDRWPGLVVEQVPEPDHTFRSLALQRRLHTSLDETREALLKAEGERVEPHIASDPLTAEVALTAESLRAPRSAIDG